MMKKTRWFTGAALAAWMQTAASLEGISNEKGLLGVPDSAEPHIAMVVGLSAYDALGGFGDLDYPQRDADAIADAFGDLGYTVIKVTSSRQEKGTAVTGQKSATRVALLKQLKALKSLFAVPNKGTIVFAYAGHGASAKGENYLIPFEGDRNELPNTALDLKTIIHELEATGARRRVLLLDACRDASQRRARGRRSTDRFVAFQFAKGYTVLFSSEFGKPSYEFRGLDGGHGVFSHFIAQGLRGKAARDDGVITFDSLSSYVENSVSDFFADTPYNQTPFRSGERHGDFLLAKVNHAATAGGEQGASKQLEALQAIRESAQIVLGAEHDDVAAILVPVDENLAQAECLLSDAERCGSVSWRGIGTAVRTEAARASLQSAKSQLEQAQDRVEVNQKFVEFGRALELGKPTPAALDIQMARLEQLADLGAKRADLRALLQRYDVRVRVDRAQFASNSATAVLLFTRFYDDGIPVETAVNKTLTLSIAKSGDEWERIKIDWQP